MNSRPEIDGEKGRIAVVGLGIIGGTVARHLKVAGWQVIGFDVAESAREKAKKSGITIAEGLAEIVETSSLIITSLPSAAAAHSVVQFLAEHAGREIIIAELSTLGLADKMALADLVSGSSCAILDCPISGTGAQAAVKDIAVYASGDPSALDHISLPFADFARTVIRLGEYGQGSKMKLVANHLVAIHNVASAEAMALGTAAGLEPDAIIAAIESGAGNSRIFELRAPMMAKRSYKPATMKLDVWLKDLDAIAALAQSLDSPTPLLDATRHPYELAVAQMPSWDTAAVFETVGNPTHLPKETIEMGETLDLSKATRSEIRDGMQIDWDVPIEMDDGTILRADVFRPTNPGTYPVLLTHGPYAKGLSFQEGYSSAWEIMAENHPDVIAGSSNKYQNWEVVDPEKWVPHGYAVVRVDSRGCGTSPGYIDHFSPRETKDFHDCIEWAGQQAWSNGKVGLNGVSYYGINQWQVASLQPRHLAAMCIWEGAADFYRDMTHHGGILSTFWANWSDMQVKTVQNGIGERGGRNPVTGDLVCGSEELDEATLAANRCAFGDEIRAHPMDDEYHRERSPDWSRITVPFLSAANWGGQGLHARGNFEGFVRAASTEKWLEAHGLEHWTHFYTDYGRALQKRFFDRFLKGDESSWANEPPVRLQIRHIDHFEERVEEAWPIPRTNWTKFHFDLANGKLLEQPVEEPSQANFDALGDGVTLLSAPVSHDLEITGPSAIKLSISSSTDDADIFAILRVFSPDMKEVVFQGAIDPHTPVGQGWLRASHRKLDPDKSEPYRPYHSHDEEQKLGLGEKVDLEVEVWPTSIVVPEGYRIALTIRGHDYENVKSGGFLSNFKNELRGCGPFLHDDPLDRPESTFAGTTTLYAGPEDAAFILLPIIPKPETK